MKLRIDKAIYGGSSLARVGDTEAGLAGKAVFIPFTLPGELVEARFAEDKRSFIQAEVEGVLEPSLLRTTAACPYFGECGGCNYQHAVYAHQLEMKTSILRETLERARLPNIPTIYSVSGKSWHYRNRIRLHLQANPFQLCYRERRSHQLLPIAQCPIAAPLLEKAITVVTEAGASLKLESFCEEIEFFTASDEYSLLLSFYSNGSARDLPARLRAISEALQKHLPQLKGTGLFVARGRHQPASLTANWGERSLTYNAADFGYQVSLGSFFQVNRFLVDALTDLATLGRKGRLAWDLYAGVGLFSRALTHSFERVIAVEASPNSAVDLRRNLENTSNRIIQATTLDFLRKQKPASAKSSTPPDLVVVDPPRAGLGSAITSLLSGIEPTCIVYVSCDPSTLSRDLFALLQSGYDLRTITMVDMFPQTFHLESVSVLTRR
ncbi:RNA methyltransferase, TrmA family [Acidisarcina polymorpha]|uniref:RNA methyltransferase, TrmA family n=1 Tax=Acidisarcina polymorpha TaxID=2211140 RepID=A0A2Z5G8L6_9BACT|nr:23S rRNA (uracil(1939)-C(5))-methyltransferase RlmD [Acidisarcina polymorpha]AXC15339.1 RNA methyltransferase, TrmA family [Acidisarcina polymorpha]